MRITLALAAIALLVASAAARGSMTYEEARKVAVRENKPVLLDFFAVWCGPCKAFAKDAESDADVRKALAGVVLCKLDAEKEGKALATEQLVEGYPTFVLTDASGATCERWAGYGKEFFLERLGEALADPTTIETKTKRFESKPTSADAVKLMRYHESRGEYEKALEFVNRALMLGAADRDLAFHRFDILASGYLRKGLFGWWNEAATAADGLLARGSATPEEIVTIYRQMRAVERKAERTDLAVRFLEPARNAVKDSEDGGLAQVRTELEIDHALLVAKDTERAVALKREAMPQAWMESPSQLNAFAWWCFENGVNLREADTLARKGVELSTPGRERAMILDTAAEISYARGRFADAVELSRQAVAEDPNSAHYPKQLARFREIQEQNAN